MENQSNLPLVSPRSVATKKVDRAFEEDEEEGSAMECDERPSSSCGPREMPSFLPSLVIEFLGYPHGLGAMVVCQGWRCHGERLFRRELLELRCVSDCVGQYLVLPETTKSTISITFSPDKRRFASTHGDHTVKIVDFASSRVVATLWGHPRTPWTVKFHPIELDLVASGCLGFEARIWSISTEKCVRRAEFDRAIISLSFDPSGEFLAVASGSHLYLWQYASGAAPQREFSHPLAIRCIRFLPQCNAIVVGAANDPNADADRPPRQRTTFALMLCDFDLDAARAGADRQPKASGLADDASGMPPLLAPIVGTGRAISSPPRRILEHALFYNDGGLDISPCGTFLCSCADFWLPLDEEDEDTDGDDEQPRSRHWWSPTQAPVAVDTESVAPSSLCGAIMRPLFPDVDRDGDDKTSTRHRGRSSGSLDDRFSSSESETSSPPRYRRGRFAVDAPQGPAGPRIDAASLARRPSLPTPRRRPRQHPFALDSPLDSAASGDESRVAARFPVSFPDVGSQPRAARRRRKRLATLTSLPKAGARGKYKPHLVVVSLVESRPNPSTGQSEGVLLKAEALDDQSFQGPGGDSIRSDIVTSVKLSPSASLVLLGHSRGGDGTVSDGVPRVVHVVYRVGDMKRVCICKKVGDDVNIARFHPVSGAGIVYGP